MFMKQNEALMKHGEAYESYEAKSETSPGIFYRSSVEFLALLQVSVLVKIPLLKHCKADRRERCICVDNCGYIYIEHMAFA